MRHVVSPGDKYGRLTVIGEVQKAAADGRRYRAALCRCDCGKQTAPRISSLAAGDAQSCGCSRGPPKYQHKRCPVCGTVAMSGAANAAAPARADASWPGPPGGHPTRPMTCGTTA
jgi:hypothetical protein